MQTFLVAVLTSWAGTGVALWVAFQLLRQNGRILQRLDYLEQRSDDSSESMSSFRPPEGLPIGSIAPEFELPDLSGNRVSLPLWRGRRILLIFLSPGCGPCLELLAQLSNLQRDHDNTGTIPIIIIKGSADEIHALADQYAINCPVLCSEAGEQPDGCLFTNYRVTGTPMGYLLDEAGRIASDLTTGSGPVLALASEAGVITLESSVSRKQQDLSKSQIARNGLAPGTRAPNFSLPCMDGRVIALDDLLGMSVLLVFSDPACGPCNELMPHLERIHQNRPDIQVLMVSRGTLEENAVKLADHDISFPVILQRKWEISRLYAFFGAPAGYLINESGIITSGLATGVNPILALALETV